jgi:hypothetical protein
MKEAKTSTSKKSKAAPKQVAKKSAGAAKKTGAVTKKSAGAAKKTGAATKKSAGAAKKTAAATKKGAAPKKGAGSAKKAAAKKPAAPKREATSAVKPPISVPGARIRFVNPRKPESAEDLSPIQRQQLERAGKLYDGNALSAEERLSPDREPGDGEDEGGFHGMLEIWDVEENGEHAYDAFLYMVDSGTVFRRGSLDVVAERIQVYFEAPDADFASYLQEAYEQAEAAHKELLRGREREGAWVAYQGALDEL